MKFLTSLRMTDTLLGVSMMNKRSGDKAAAPLIPALQYKRHTSFRGSEATEKTHGKTNPLLKYNR